jgi:hypothetical protein
MEQERKTSSKRETWDAYLTLHGVSMGMAHGAMINAEMLQVLNEAQDKIQESKNDDEPPEPKNPPSRPNAPLGRVALSF